MPICLSWMLRFGKLANITDFFFLFFMVFVGFGTVLEPTSCTRLYSRSTSASYCSTRLTTKSLEIKTPVAVCRHSHSIRSSCIPCTQSWNASRSKIREIVNLPCSRSTNAQTSHLGVTFPMLRRESPCVFLLFSYYLCRCFVGNACVRQRECLFIVSGEANVISIVNRSFDSFAVC